MLRLSSGVIALAALTATGGLLASGAGAQSPGAPVVPIPTDPGNSSVAPFEGGPASPNPVDATDPPQHPFMAPNGRSNIHNDPYMSGAYRVSGPMTDGPEVSTLFSRECASVMFDSQGRIVTICVGLDRPVLALLDPDSLAVLAAMQLPVRNLSSGNNPFNDFSGGGYFFLDHRDQAVLSTNERHVLEVAIGPGPSFVITRDVDLSQELAGNDGIISVLPDWSGRLWFVTRRGVVGTIDRASGDVKLRQLTGEGISNSFSVDETGGVFIVSDRALYRFDAGPNGGPTITWRVVYPNSGIHKPSQSDAGSGTTPDLMGKELVAITDNADPMNVQVYRRAANLDPSAAEEAEEEAEATRRHRPVGVDRDRRRFRGRIEEEKGEEEAEARGDRRGSSGLLRAGLSAGRERHRQLTDQHQQGDRGGEQLRLHGDRFDHERGGHRARPHPDRRVEGEGEAEEGAEEARGQEAQAQEAGPDDVQVHDRLDQLRAGPVGGAEALARQRLGIRLHEAPAGR